MTTNFPSMSSLTSSHDSSTSTPLPSSSVRNGRPVTSLHRSTTVPSKFIVDWNEPNKSPTRTAPTHTNLQDAFLRFRSQRINEIQLQQDLNVKKKKKKKKIRRSDPERMRRLRIKFVEQAKKYLGIPYAKKYFQPGTPEYESKLFLDCCGLVRRVMYDLAKDFGFVIGPWNQSYMYDTLPTTITHLSDVQPGDLVFISATYYNPKMKKQRHNLTHVEIMLGDGEKTIGARWNDGKVQFFDSYKFVSKSYHSQIYTIKSLDPWLKGICKSYCSEHTWYRRRPKKLTKKSIFYTKDEHQRSPSKASKSNSASSTRRNHHRRKSKHRSARSKSGKPSSSTRLTTESDVVRQQTITVGDEISSSSDDDADINDRHVENLVNEITNMNCQDDPDQCDDSDSLDEALDAEMLDDDLENNATSPLVAP